MLSVEVAFTRCFYPGYGGTRTFTVLRESCTLYTFTVLRQKALTFTLPPPYDGMSHETLAVDDLVDG